MTTERSPQACRPPPVVIVITLKDGTGGMTSRDTWDGAASYLISAPFTAIRDRVAAVTITAEEP